MRSHLLPFVTVIPCLLLNAAGAGVAYGEALLQGLEGQPELEAYLEEIVREREDDVKTPIQMADDITLALKSKGFYDAEVTVENAAESAGQVYSIKTGTAYKIGNVRTENAPADTQPLSINEGDILDARKVLQAQKELYDTIEQNQCYYNLDVTHAVFLNEENKTADIVFTVKGEDNTHFGQTVFNGANDIERAYLENYLAYAEGDCWQAGKLEDTKAGLYATGLLASVKAELPENAEDGGKVPVVFDLKERAFRSVKLGAGYNTSDGAGVTAEWEHRNIFGAGEKLSFKGRFYEVVQTVSALFDKPFFLRDDQSLLLETSLNSEDNDAYQELSYNISGSVLRQLTDEISVSLGTGYELSRIEDEEGERTYGLFSVPASLDYDGRDDILDPHNGWKATFRVAPFFDTLGEASPFIKTRLTASTYFDLSDSSFDPVLALRASYGSIYGTDLTDVPASKRFYAGGGGSLRGFGYQDVGPKDSDGDPSGGLSVIEMTGEMRFKLGQSLGAVAFVDAGQVYEDSHPDFGADLAIGAGVGARYYTDFGPLRFDIAVPVNHRDDADGAYQFYLSIGQAF